MIKPNNIDLKILKIINSSKEPITIYSITKILYPELKEGRNISQKSTPIRQRIKKLLKEDLIFGIQNKLKNTYVINESVFKFTKKASLMARGRKYVLAEVCMIKDNGDWNFYQITY